MADSLSSTTGLGDKGDSEESSNMGEKGCNFYQIRKRFEEKSKSLPSALSQGLLISEVKASPRKSDFQQNYPDFKCCFTKRQFAAMENCFNLADGNNDGFLEPKEIKKMLIDHKQLVNLCDAELIVSESDKNHDGKLCPREFLEMCRPAAEAIREELFQQGNPFLSDKDYVAKIMQKVRSRVNPIHPKVKGTRLYFENISSGGGDEVEVLATANSSTVANQHLKILTNKNKDYSSLVKESSSDCE